MGQNTSTGGELAHAMKKMRLSPKKSNEYINSKATGRISTPSTPHHKAISSNEYLLNLAANAPLESVPSPSVSESPQPLIHATQNDVNPNEFCCQNELPTFESSPQSTAVANNTSSLTAINISDVDKLTNEEIKEFLRIHKPPLVTVRQTYNVPNNSFKRNDGQNVAQYANEDPCQYSNSHNY